MRRTPGGYSYSYILLRVAILTRHSLRGGRIEDACGDVTGHPFVKLQALILDGLFRWMAVSFWAVSLPSWGSNLALGGCHLGAGWADEGLDVAWLVGCHLLGRGVSEKG